MQRHTRDLRNAGIYAAAVAVLIGAVTLSAGVVADVLTSGTALQQISAALEPDKEEERSRVSRMIESSREIRAALAKPVGRVPPLPPITATLAHGELRTAARPKPPPQQKRKLPIEAMDAMAQGAPHAWQVQSQPRAVRANPQFELHKVY